MNLQERLDKHIQSIKEEYVFINVKKPTSSYTNNQYDRGMLNQQNGQVEVAKNISSNELGRFLKESERKHLRGEIVLKYEGEKPKVLDYYFWDATRMLHLEIQKRIPEDEFSLSILIDSSRVIVKQNIFDEIEDGDGIYSVESAKIWAKTIQEILNKYSMKLTTNDQKRLSNWSKGLYSNGEEIEEDD